MRTINLLPLIALLACSQSGEPSPAVIRGGTFAYTASSAAGAPLLIGQITLEIAADSSVTGSWKIAWAPGADTTVLVGPQIGTGLLAGRLAGTSLWLDLNPGWADYNVFLQADSRNQGYAGQWYLGTITGTRSSGTFTALQ